ncbi:MAG: glucose-1-phosphate cytidylyltransferase [Candidatus Endolissoclinum sp. TMED37]|nr:MAG: glucose-1-phosphate cytidylyltransferase [Candidatus Endolissoclinum sp. TMED37]|tara:strand:- start:295 stop:1068 length:774 start_codon:yes stop_codon:yes gene_type:complete
MKAVILAGGLGTRLSEETILKPKPMVEIGNKPILWHIMKIYSHHGIDDFIICGGYKFEYIKNYFSNYSTNNSDIKVDLESRSIKIINKHKENWSVTLVDTGKDTMTGGRLKRIEKYIDDDFCFTYGDGLSNVNIKKLIKQHKKDSSIATLTAVLPPERFGTLKINKKNNKIELFKEKPKNLDNWINGGYFVLSPKIFRYIKNDKSIFEREVLEELSKKKLLSAFKHKNFWYAMDKLSDKIHLNQLWEKEKAPWKIWR